MKFSRVRFHLCWNVKLGSNESALSCITSWVISWSEMQNRGRRDFMDIEAFHYAHVVKSILWTVIGCWHRNWYIGVYIYNCLLQPCHRFCIELWPVLFLSASWGCWVSKCCYYCCLFYMLEQWLLHLPTHHPHMWAGLHVGYPLLLGLACDVVITWIELVEFLMTEDMVMYMWLVWGFNCCTCVITGWCWRNRVQE